jgi:hypothetical protein
MNAWMERVTYTAEEIYGAFLAEVVEKHVLPEREGLLSEGQKRIAKGTHIDTRVVCLMAVSGKGGWSEDPKDREKYAKSTNVTLLDHLLSVARGALMLAALDWLGRNPEMDSEVLKHRLRVIAVLAFLHDLDKIVRLERDTALPLTAVEEALQRYGLAAFLAGGAITLSADQIR